MKKNKEIKIGTEGTYAPYSYHTSDGKLTGFDVEIATELAKRLGVKPIFVETKWDSMIAGLDAGRFDVIINQVAVTDQRKQKFDFSNPYIYIHEVLIVRKDNNTLKKFEQLKGQNVAQVLGSNLGKKAEKYGGKLVSVDGFQQSVDLVRNGRAVGTVNTDVVFADYLKKKPDAPLKIVDTNETPVVCAIPVKKGNDDLVKAINEQLEAMKKDGTLKKISNKYFGKDVTINK
ncbi:MAG: amino acid ABC transporter substrate-binding protein [Acidaminococcaceae bacterium]|nr:amino acid ABC transporter substrate-binding protein [Acidaminococcaceae bacterium]